MSRTAELESCSNRHHRSPFVLAHSSVAKPTPSSIVSANAGKAADGGAGQRDLGQRLIVYAAWSITTIQRPSGSRPPGIASEDLGRHSPDRSEQDPELDTTRCRSSRRSPSSSSPWHCCVDRTLRADARDPSNPVKARFRESQGLLCPRARLLWRAVRRLETRRHGLPPTCRTDRSPCSLSAMCRLAVG
jgi:hypothetical protein